MPWRCMFCLERNVDTDARCAFCESEGTHARVYPEDAIDRAEYFHDEGGEG